MTVNLSPDPIQHFVDNFGNALNGGQLFTYAAGTTTKLATYTDSTGSTTNTNPVILNTRGEANVWLNPTLLYKLILSPSTDSDPPLEPIWTIDNVQNPVIAISSALQPFVTSSTTQAALALLNYLGTESGSIIRLLTAKLGDVPSVKDFGAAGNGTSDDTLSIQAAFNNGPCFFPAGTYLVSAALTITIPGRYWGMGRATTITTNNQSADTFQINATTGGVSVDSMRFDATVTKTGGAFINVNTAASRVLIESFEMFHWNTGILIGANAFDVWITKGDMLFGNSVTGVGIQITGNGTFWVDKVQITTQVGGPQGSAGILIQAAQAVILSDLDIEVMGTDLLVQPSGTNTVASLWAHNCFFDTATHGVVLNSGSGTSIVRTVFDHCWTSSHSSDGFDIECTGSGVISDVQITGHSSFNNTGNGLNILNTGSEPINITVNGGAFSGNTLSGIAVASANFAGGLTIVGARCGYVGGIGPNTTGINLATGADNFIIAYCDLRNNATIGIGLPSLGGTPGVSNLIVGNLGFPTSASGTQTWSGTSTSIVSHGLGFTPNINDITITPQTSISTATGFWVSTVTSTTFTISLSTIPAGSVSFGWRVRSFGS